MSKINWKGADVCRNIEKKQKQTKTALDRRHKWGYFIAWTNTTGNNGLGICPKTMEIIPLSPWTDDDDDDGFCEFALQSRRWRWMRLWKNSTWQTISSCRPMVSSSEVYSSTTGRYTCWTSETTIYRSASVSLLLLLLLLLLAVFKNIYCVVRTRFYVHIVKWWAMYWMNSSDLFLLHFYTKTAKMCELGRAV